MFVQQSAIMSIRYGIWIYFFHVYFLLFLFFILMTHQTCFLTVNFVLHIFIAIESEIASLFFFSTANNHLLYQIPQTTYCLNLFIVIIIRQLFRWLYLLDNRKFLFKFLLSKLFMLIFFFATKLAYGLSAIMLKSLCKFVLHLQQVCCLH